MDIAIKEFEQSLNKINIKLDVYKKEQERINNEIENLETDKKTILEQLHQLKTNINSPENNYNIFDEPDLKVCGMGALTQQEKQAISDGIDKTDYRHLGDYPRYIDLDKIVERVWQIKQADNWTLVKVTKTGTYEPMPSAGKYTLTFRPDQDTFICNLT
jgi:flagellar biosynthesis/type III secretory pathway chaperone